MSARGAGRSTTTVAFLCGLGLAGLAGAPAALAQSATRTAPSPTAADRVLAAVDWRAIGPANTSGRFVDIAAHPSEPYTVYVAHSTGGVFKTPDNGITWQPLFQHEGTTNVGAVAVAPSDPAVVWVGTGEGNNRNSTGWGLGVFKSGDGGRTWRQMGLGDSHHIPAGCIIVHPTNPDVVHVCAAGRLWGEGGERGVYRTTDGGESWRRVLHVDDRTGFTHMVMDPIDPRVLYAASYERLQTTTGYEGIGPGSGIYKTTDGGDTWSELTDPSMNSGLPTGPVGRIGLALYAADPRIVMAVIEEPGAGGDAGSSPTNGIYRSEDAGRTWSRVNHGSVEGKGSYYGKIRINPRDDQDVWVLSVYLTRSRDGGRTFDLDMTERGARWVHGDHHAMWIDPADPRRVVMGSDGGIYFSFDGGSRWDYIDTVPVGQFYKIGYDYKVPYRVCGGTQDNGSWCGPSDSWQYWGITNRDWYWVHGADGFDVQIAPEHPWRMYVTSQNGNYHRLDMRDWRKMPIQPRPDRNGAGEAERFCWDWDTPSALSRHDPSVLYLGAQFVIRLTDHGDRWERISPDLTHGRTLGDCKALRTVEESALDGDVLWAGTADGYVHVTRDGGGTWTNVTANVPGGADRWDGYHVPGLAASRHAPGTAYVAFDGHRSDDYAPHLFVTTDFGQSFTEITGNLPSNGSIYVVREDHRNPDLLFVGTEFGVFASLDRGAHWAKFHNNLPDVPVFDLAIHDRDNELIAGTHGRSIWIADIGPLQEAASAVLDAPVHLFDVKPAWIHNVPRVADIMGHKAFRVPRKPYGTAIRYWVRDPGDGDVRIVVRDADGAVVRRMSGPGYAGVQTVIWNLRRDEPRRRGLGDPPPGVTGGDSPGPGGAGRVPQAGSLIEVLPGTYTVTVRVGEAEVTKPVVVTRLTAEQAGDPWYVELPRGSR